MTVGNHFLLIEIFLVGFIYLSLYVIVFVGREKNKVLLKMQSLPVAVRKKSSVKQKLNEI